MAKVPYPQQESPFNSNPNRADMLRALKVIGDMLQHRRIPLSVRGARGLGFLITLAVGTLGDDVPPRSFNDPA